MIDIIIDKSSFEMLFIKQESFNTKLVTRPAACDKLKTILLMSSTHKFTG